jgi:acetylornithine/N-succinyldiaminopimelate aminotransferase
MPTYARTDVVFEEGDGMYLTATTGRRYLDFGAGVAVSSLGHNHPRLIAAIKGQADKLLHSSNLYRVAGQERVAGRLIAQTFADTVFFCNSGAEAMEGVIKVMRKYHHACGNPERYRIIVAEGAFHGRTLATLAAGGQEKHLKGFGPVVEGFDRVPFDDAAAVERAIGADTAGILVEPIQGEGGIRPASPGYLQALRNIADKAGILLAFDEVQCGNGRTGKLYAHQWAGIAPDVMGTAKGLGGGFPIGAVLSSERAAIGMTAGAHGSTFGGNPMAMAAANAVLDVILADGFLDQVRRVGKVLSDTLATLVEAHPKVLAEHRGMGLMQGVKCRIPSGELGKALFEAGLLTIGAGDNVLRLVPPLIVGEDHVAEAAEIIDRCCRKLAA